MPPPKPANRAIVDEVRDCLANEFAVAMWKGEATVTEILEQQLDSVEDRDKWRPLRQAIGAARDLAPTLRGKLEARTRARFDAKLSPEAGEFSQTARFSLDTLSLVSEEEVQEEIAIGNATRRMREATTDEFFALNARLAAILGHDKLEEENSPAHARVFARALLDVLASELRELAPRVALFAAHDPSMLHALPRAYKAANELLVRRGILPNLKRTYGAPQQVAGVRAVSRRGAADGSPAAEAGAPAMPNRPAAAQMPPEVGLFDRLLAGAATASPPATALPAAAPSGASSAPSPAPAGLITLQVRPELVEALRKLEARLAADPQAFEDLQPALPGVEPAPSYSPDVLHRAREEVATELTPTDALIADLLAAVFGRLFIDPDVSDAAKVQLGRLQLPVFKVVMTDRRFFTDPDHPIRGLIDTIAELGASDDAYHVDGKLPAEWLSEETQALLDAEQLDTQAFAAARDRLAAVAEHHREVLDDTDAVVKSVRREDAEHAALQDASLEVVHRITASECPQAAASFVYRAWRPVLSHDHRTLGRGSEPWNADLKTLDDLLWTLAPRATATERERLATLLPSVRVRLWQGLIRAQFTTEQIESLLDELDRLHGELTRAPLAAAKEDFATTVSLGPTLAEDFTATLHVSSEEIRDEGLARGAWFEFTEDDGSTRRARLAWVSPVQGACVFKDIARNRSFAISLTDLRAKRELGRAVAVDGPGVASSSIEGALQDVARDRGTVPSA